MKIIFRLECICNYLEIIEIMGIIESKNYLNIFFNFIHSIIMNKDNENKHILTFLINLKKIIKQDHNVTKNKLLNIKGTHLLNMNDASMQVLYTETLQYVESKYTDNLEKYEKILSSIDEKLNKYCDHDWIDDHIEHIYSETSTTIRYCSICEITD